VACTDGACPALFRRAASMGAFSRGTAQVVDFHDRRQAQEELRNTQAELAHVNRVMTMGELHGLERARRRKPDDSSRYPSQRDCATDSCAF
jgi:hypothetical protein